MAAASGGGGGVSHRLLLLLFTCGCWPFSSAARPVARHRRDVQRHLNRLNKPAVKSIESPDGDIINCVHVAHQPAFDHSFLKNHTIQTRPSYHPEGLFVKAKADVKEKNNPMPQLWYQRGTMPIRRTKGEDVMRANSVKRFGRKNHTAATPQPKSVDPNLISQSGH